MFWPDVPLAERVSQVAALGYPAYEFWGWWEKDLDAFERATKETGLDMSACCVRTAFNSDAPPMLLPEGKGPFVQAVKDALTVHDRLGCKTFIVTVGDELDGVPRAAQREACATALKAAAPVAEDAGVTLVLEPLNLLVDHAGYYLATSAEGFQIVNEVGSPAVKLLFDIYHQQITEGNLTPSIRENIDLIGHFHVANHPGRHEPGSEARSTTTTCSEQSRRRPTTAISASSSRPATRIRRRTFCARFWTWPVRPAEPRSAVLLRFRLVGAVIGRPRKPQ